MASSVIYRGFTIVPAEIDPYADQDKDIRVIARWELYKDGEVQRTPIFETVERAKAWIDDKLK